MSLISPFNSSEIKIAFVVGCPDGRSERYRVTNIVNAFWEKNIVADRYCMEEIDKLIQNVKKYNLVILFRCFCELDVLELLFIEIYKYKVFVIYDMDDLKTETPNLPRHNRIYKNIISCCHAVTCTTEYIAKRVEKSVNKRTYVIPNTLNNYQVHLAKTQALKKQDNLIKIVYQSGTNTHDQDFKVAEKALLSTLKKHKNVQLHVIGPCSLDKKFGKENVIFQPYMDYLELQRYVAYMDINIAPLQIIPYKEGKSELKIFESGLVKIPTVASPIDSYKRCINNGVNGFLAYTEKEWEDILDKLVNNNILREKIGNQAYKDFTDKYFIDNCINDIIYTYRKIITQPYENLLQNLRTRCFHKKRKLFWYERVFSVLNSRDKSHKIITLLGLQLKIKRHV